MAACVAVVTPIGTVPVTTTVFETLTVPLMTTVLETLTVPLTTTVLETLIVPVTIAVTVPVATTIKPVAVAVRPDDAVVENNPELEMVPEITTVFETDIVPLTTTVFETLTVPLITTVFGMVAVTVCDAASHTSPPVTPLACVVVVGTLLEPPETETVPEMTTVLETLTVPLTAADTVCVGANQIRAPVTAA